MIKLTTQPFFKYSDSSNFREYALPTFLYANKCIDYMPLRRVVNQIILRSS